MNEEPAEGFGWGIKLEESMFLETIQQCVANQLDLVVSIVSLFDWILLQCCVSFKYTAKWFSYTHTHTHTYVSKCLALSCVQLFATRGLWPTRLLCPWDSPGKNTGVVCHSLLQGTFLTHGSNPCLLCFLHWKMGSLPSKSPEKPPFICVNASIYLKALSL